MKNFLFISETNDDVGSLMIFFKKDLFILGLPWWLIGKQSACQRRGHGFNP